MHSDANGNRLTVVRENPKVYNGIKKMHLETNFGAHLFASFQTKSFHISVNGHEYSGWNFDRASCEEAIKFFTNLRDDLKERGF